jgi:hypothetical protein
MNNTICTTEFLLNSNKPNEIQAIGQLDTIELLMKYGNESWVNMVLRDLNNTGEVIIDTITRTITLNRG